MTTATATTSVVKYYKQHKRLKFESVQLTMLEDGVDKKYLEHYSEKYNFFMKIAAVFGGARISEEMYSDTIQIGRILAENGYHIKTGGYGGVMEAIPRGATEVGGTATGYTCATFPTSTGNQFLTETIVADDLYHRLRLMIEDTDLFILQRGGIGTLSELFLVMDIVRKKKKNQRPKIILVGQVWRPIITSIEALLTNGETDSLTIVNDHTQILSQIN